MVGLSTSSLMSWALVGAFGSVIAFLASAFVVLAVLRAVALLVSNRGSSSNDGSRNWSASALSPSPVDASHERGRQRAALRDDPTLMVWSFAEREDTAHGGVRRSAAS